MDHASGAKLASRYDTSIQSATGAVTAHTGNISIHITSQLGTFVLNCRRTPASTASKQKCSHTAQSMPHQVNELRRA